MSLHLYVLFFSCAVLSTAMWSASPELSDGKPFASIDLDRCAKCNSLCEDKFQDDRPCQCDSNCGIYGDCCNECTGQKAEPMDFQCLSVYLNTSIISPPSVGATFWMVATCPVFWTAGESEKGERTKIANDCTGRIDLPPVSDRATGIVYKNENCAVCNEVTNPVVSWSYQLECPSEIAFPKNVTVDYLLKLCPPSHFTSPGPAPGPDLVPSPRLCYPNTVLTAMCLSRTDLETTTGAAYSSEEYSELLSNCTQGPYSLVRPSCGSRALYRNQYCARCNGFDGELDCYSVGDLDLYVRKCSTEPFAINDTNEIFPDFILNGTNETLIFPELVFNSTNETLIFPGFVFNGTNETFPGFETRPGPGPGPVPTFSVLLDISGDGQVVITSESVEITVNVTCEPNQVFDPVNGVCRLTVCSEEGTCMSLGNSTINCTSIALNASEYEVLGNNTILWNGNVEEVQGTFMGNPVICVNFTNNGTRQENMTVLFYSYPAGFVELTYIGGALSIIGCLLILVTYAIFKELQTLPSLILMNIAAAILVYILFLLVGSPLGQLSQEFCIAVAIIIQLFVLAQFAWMTILLFEMARSFYNALKFFSPELTEKSKTRHFLMYMVIGWSVPLIITMTTIAINFTTDFVLYGETEDGTQGRCWINHPNSLIVAFIVPISVAYLLNVGLFMIVSVFLFKAWRGQSKVQKDKNLLYLRVYLAVFAASGLTWLFGFIALLVDTNWSWYPFIIFNSSQGFLIFIVFLCTKKIAKLYLSFFKCNTITMATLSKSTSKTGMPSRGTSKNGTVSAMKLNNYSSHGLPQSQDCDPTTGDSPV